MVDSEQNCRRRSIRARAVAGRRVVALRGDRSDGGRAAARPATAVSAGTPAGVAAGRAAATCRQQREQQTETDRDERFHAGFLKSGTVGRIPPITMGLARSRRKGGKGNREILHSPAPHKSRSRENLSDRRQICNSCKGSGVGSFPEPITVLLTPPARRAARGDLPDVNPDCGGWCAKLDGLSAANSIWKGPLPIVTRWRSRLFALAFAARFFDFLRALSNLSRTLDCPACRWR